MKNTLLLTVALALTLVSGCVVVSVYPYYAAKDIISDPALIGVWTDPANTNSNKETWTFEKLDGQTLKLTTVDGSETNQFDAHLFKLGGATFLDCLIRTRSGYSSPSHILFRVDSVQPLLKMRLLDYDWLTTLIEKHPKVIRHVIVPSAGKQSSDEGDLVLTADTAELQKFILKHLKTGKAWGEEAVMKKQ